MLKQTSMNILIILFEENYVVKGSNLCSIDCIQKKKKKKKKKEKGATVLLLMN